MTVVFALLSLSACAAEGEHTLVVLADTAVHLTVEPTVFRPSEFLPATDDINGVCVTPAEGDSLNDDWTLPGADGRPAALRAEAILADSSVVPLRSSAWSGELCLHPETSGPLSGGVREVRVWASTPIVAQRITWISTHK